jgi:glycine betaine/proline transport system ATP-binding protein
MVSEGSLANAARAAGEPRWEDALIQDLPPATADTELSDVLSQVSGSDYPVPVVGADGRYRGIVDKTILLQTLDKTT